MFLGRKMHQIEDPQIAFDTLGPLRLIQSIQVKFFLLVLVWALSSLDYYINRSFLPFLVTGHYTKSRTITSLAAMRTWGFGESCY